MPHEMDYLVDTDWVIDYLNRAERTVRRIEELLPAGIGLSIVSVAELYEGLVGSNRPEEDEAALRLFLEAVDVVPLEDDCVPSLRRRTSQTPKHRGIS